MTKERRLGRGLEALLGRTLEQAQSAPLNQTPATAERARDSADDDNSNPLQMINVYEIDGNPFQPRKDFDQSELASLAESIREHGLLQPIVVREKDYRYQVIAGERRLRASILAGMKEVPAQIMECDDRRMTELAIVENLQRKDLNALEKAVSFQRYLQAYNCKQEELAKRLSIDRSNIANHIRLLELPAEVQEALRLGEISLGHARAILPLGEPHEQIKFTKMIQEDKWNVRETEEMVAKVLHGDKINPLSIIRHDPTQEKDKRAKRSENINLMEQELKLKLGTRVEIRTAGKGRGKFMIHFTSHEEFLRLKALFLASSQQGHPRTPNSQRQNTR